MCNYCRLLGACFAKKVFPPNYTNVNLNISQECMFCEKTKVCNYFVFWFCFSMSLMYSKVNGNICNLCHLLMRLKLNKKCSRLKKPTNTWSTTNIGDLLRTTRLPTGVIYWELQQVFVINHMTWWIWFEIDYFSVNDWYLIITTSITNELVIF